MEHDKLKAIAHHSGTSVSTVRRVLYHCSGVAAETRQAVINAQCALQHSLESSGRRLYFILPDNPKFFWHQALNVLNGYLFDPPVKLSFYPSLQQHALLKTYLEPLLAEDNAVLILAADLNQEESELVSCIAERCPVIQLCRYTPLAGTTYVGADAYKDGLALGEYARKTAVAQAVILKPQGYNAGETCRGFAEGYGHPVTVIPEPEEGNLYPSMVARALDEHKNAELVFSPSGRTAELCRAIHKLRRPLHCYGCEVSAQLKSMPESHTVRALLQQNLAEQTRTALELARAYLQNGTPPEKSAVIVPSKIVTL